MCHCYLFNIYVYTAHAWESLENAEAAKLATKPQTLGTRGTSILRPRDGTPEARTVEAVLHHLDTEQTQNDSNALKSSCFKALFHSFGISELHANVVAVMTATACKKAAAPAISIPSCPGKRQENLSLEFRKSTAAGKPWAMQINVALHFKPFKKPLKGLIKELKRPGG